MAGICIAHQGYELGCSNCQYFLVWQHIGQDSWVFGEKVRGLVRKPVAEVYFTEGTDPNGKDYGWVWFLNSPGTTRGMENKLQWAVEAAEKALGITEG